jgi:myosin heavy subunit
MINDNINQYRYLNQSTVYDIKGLSDEKNFTEVSNDFMNYFKKEEIDCIFKILSIVLNIGNLVFRKELTKNN